MSLTQTDLENLEAAMLTLATEGFASVTIGGQTTTVKSLDELLRFSDRMAAGLASSKARFGVRFTKLIPPGGG